MFTIIPITYIPSMLLVQKLPAWIDRRLTLILATFFLGLATLLNGPSKVLDMPDKLHLIMLGQAFSGVFVAFLTIPALPEMINAANLQLRNSQRGVAGGESTKQKVNTLCSGLFNASLGIG